MPTVSVIINCLNGSRYLREAIDSVYAQTYRDWEIVFWDNASTDESLAIARSYDQRIRCHRGERTVPLGAARNLAFRKAGGQFAAILDADDVWLPDKLTQQLPLFERDPDVGLTCSDSVAFNEHGSSYTQFAVARPHRGRVARQLFRKNFISSETMIYSLRHLRALPEWFDDRFSVVADFDLSVRVADRWKIDYVDAPLSRWRINPDGFTLRNMDRYHDECELLLDKLARSIPDFETRFHDAIVRFRGDLAYKRGCYAWQNDRTGEARSHFRRNPGRPRCLLALLASYGMSYRHFLSAIELRNSILLHLRKTAPGRCG